jgi:hypothetical protein
MGGQKGIPFVQLCGAERCKQLIKLNCASSTGWSKSLSAPDDYNTESYKYCSKCPPPVSRHLLTRRTVFSKTVFSIARSKFRMYSVMAIFISSIVYCTVIVRGTDTFWSLCISQYYVNLIPLLFPIRKHFCLRRYYTPPPPSSTTNMISRYHNKIYNAIIGRQRQISKLDLCLTVHHQCR